MSVKPNVHQRFHQLQDSLQRWVYVSLRLLAAVHASVAQLVLLSPNILSNCDCPAGDFNCTLEMQENNIILNACLGDSNIPDFNFSIPDFNFSIPNFNYSDFNISTPNFDYGFSEACENTLSQCLREASCFTEIARYLNACQSAFIGRKPSDCSPECMASYSMRRS